MQLEYNACRKYDVCNRKLSHRFLDEYSAPPQENFCIELIPTAVDDTNKNDFTAARCVTVTTLADWQAQNGNGRPEDAVPQKELSPYILDGPYMRIRCEMPPQLKEAFCPWLGEVMFDTRTKFK